MVTNDCVLAPGDSGWRDWRHAAWSQEPGSLWSGTQRRPAENKVANSLSVLGRHDFRAWFISLKKNSQNHDQRIVCGFDLIQLNQTQLLGYLSRKENRRDKVTRSMTKEDLCLYFKMSYFYLVLMHDIRFMTRAPSTHFHRDEHMTHVNYSKYFTNEMLIKFLFSRFSSSSDTIQTG